MITTQRGPVGFFDILGYQQFLKNNCPETAAETVRSVLDALVCLKDEMLLEMMADANILQEQVQVQPKWLVFSDTVLITLDTSKIAVADDEPQSLSEKTELHWIVFLLQCISLWNKMFKQGLPLRGAISYGPFVVEETCFVGRPIVRAYKLANDLNCAGVALDVTAREWSKDAFGLGVLYLDYALPSKVHGSVEGTVLNLAYSLQKRELPWGVDPRRDIENGFSAHNKGLGHGVAAKVENTEALLRFLRANWPPARK
jgi:hypothetical protein